MNDERIHAPRRYVSDAAFHLGAAERCIRSARRSGARGDHDLEKLERGAKNLRQLTRLLERGQA